MTPIHLFALISQHNKWLSVRQTAVAGNIANANTPGFAAMDTQPFEAALNNAPLAMKTTRVGHMEPPQSPFTVSEGEEQRSWDITHSGNSVSLEQELIKANEIHKAFALNAGVTKAFHRMILASAKGP